MSEPQDDYSDFHAIRAIRVKNGFLGKTRIRGSAAPHFRGSAHDKNGGNCKMTINSICYYCFQ